MGFVTVVENILEVYNLNASDFAKKIDVQRSSISHILSGRNKPSLDMLIKIKEAFPELRWDYLLLGKLPMTEREFEDLQKSSQKNDIKNDKQGDLFEPEIASTTPSHCQSEESLKDDIQNSKSSKTLRKIVWFYDDNTFEVFENKF